MRGRGGGRGEEGGEGASLPSPSPKHYVHIVSLRTCPNRVEAAPDPARHSTCWLSPAGRRFTTQVRVRTGIKVRRAGGRGTAAGGRYRWSVRQSRRHAEVREEVSGSQFPRVVSKLTKVKAFLAQAVVALFTGHHPLPALTPLLSCQLRPLPRPLPSHPVYSPAPQTNTFGARFLPSPARKPRAPTFPIPR